MENQMPPLPDSAEQSAEAEVKPVKKAKEIDVVATRSGFWKNRRMNEGDQFTIPHVEKAGEWMRCLDPGMEKRRLEMIKERKKKAAGN